MSNKRRRSGRRGTRRPIDKQIITLNFIGGINVSQTLLIVQEGALTLTGLRWNLSFRTNTGAGPPQFWWAIVVVKDGNDVNAIGISNLDQMYTPEQSVMAWGAGVVNASGDSGGPKSVHQMGTTKVMRKMMEGDSLHLVTTADIQAGVLIGGGVQFFTLF